MNSDHEFTVRDEIFVDSLLTENEMVTDRGRIINHLDGSCEVILSDGSLFMFLAKDKSLTMYGDDGPTYLGPEHRVFNEDHVEAMCFYILEE